MANAILTLRGRFAWAHDFDPDRNIAATFQALPGASFVVNGAAQAPDSALTTASAEMKWLNGWSAGATFEGEFSECHRKLCRQRRRALRLVTCRSRGRHAHRRRSLATPGIPATRSVEPPMRNCTSGNLEIPGSTLRVAPE